jgi:hypothetical protein
MAPPPATTKQLPIPVQQIKNALARDGANINWDKAERANVPTLNGFSIPGYKVPTGNNSNIFIIPDASPACTPNGQDIFMCVRPDNNVVLSEYNTSSVRGKTTLQVLLPWKTTLPAEQQSKAIYKHSYLHELDHAKNGVLEWRAYRNQLTKMAKEGLITPLTDDQAMQYVLAVTIMSSPEKYVAAVFERFKGDQNNPELKSWLPRGQKFNDAMSKLISQYNTLIKNSASDSLQAIKGLGGLKELDDHIKSTNSNNDLKRFINSGVKEYYVREYILKEAQKSNTSFEQMTARRAEWSAQFRTTGRNPPNDYANEKVTEWINRG